MRFSGYDLNLNVINQLREKPSERQLTQSMSMRFAINRTQLLFGSQESEPGQVSIDGPAPAWLRFLGLIMFVDCQSRCR